MSVCLKVGGMNRYEFSLRRLDGCLQICAENRGNIFVYEKMAVGDVMQIREPQILYFGKNHREEYSRTLEFPGKERVELPIRVITLEDCSAFSCHFCFIVSVSWKYRIGRRRGSGKNLSAMILLKHWIGVLKREA